MDLGTRLFYGDYHQGDSFLDGSVVNIKYLTVSLIIFLFVITDIIATILWFNAILKKQGLAFRMKTRVTGAKPMKGKVRLTMEDSDGRTDEADFDRVLVAVGRRPLTDGLGLEAQGVDVDARTGLIRVDSRYRTSVPSVLAIGDLIPGPMLAHKASAEGIAAVECLAGKAGEVHRWSLRRSRKTGDGCVFDAARAVGHRHRDRLALQHAARRGSVHRGDQADLAAAVGQGDFRHTEEEARRRLHHGALLVIQGLAEVWSGQRRGALQRVLTGLHCAGRR